MAGFNKVILLGNLTRDPELRTTPSGGKVASFGVAVSEPYQDRNGQRMERTCFVDIDVWNRGPNGKLADLCAQYLAKGRQVLLEGRLEQHEWTTTTGERRSKMRVNADSVKFLSRPQSAAETTAESAPAKPTAPVVDPGIPEEPPF